MAHKIWHKGRYGKLGSDDWLQEYCPYDSQGRLHGTFYTYRGPDGSIASETEYEHGKKGETRTYDEDGNLRSRFNEKRGPGQDEMTLSGYKEYDTSGRVVKEGTVYDGEFYGTDYTKPRSSETRSSSSSSQTHYSGEEENKEEQLERANHILREALKRQGREAVERLRYKEEKRREKSWQKLQQAYQQAREREKAIADQQRKQERIAKKKELAVSPKKLADVVQPNEAPLKITSFSDWCKTAQGKEFLKCRGEVAASSFYEKFIKPQTQQMTNLFEQESAESSLTQRKTKGIRSRLRTTVEDYRKWAAEQDKRFEETNPEIARQQALKKRFESEK